MEVFRFFSGNSKNPDGTVQFVSGKTRLSETLNGVIKIVTVAVSINLCCLHPIFLIIYIAKLNNGLTF